MIRRGPRLAIAAGAFVLLAAAAPAAATLPDGFADTTIVSGLSTPIGMAFLPDGRLLVTEQQGAIRLVVDTTVAGVHGARADVVGQVDSVEAIDTEEGLLGIAVDPRWPAKPYVYIHCTSVGGHVRVSRYRLQGALTGTGPLALDVASRYDLVNDVPNESPEHQGGTLRFGTDQMLYASFGEDQQRCLARDTTRMLGVILRLDVMRLPDGPGVAPRDLVTPAGNPFANHPNANARLVWAMGFRNPFRFHIDPTNSVISVGDVGQAKWEELDLVPNGGHDYGWPLMEGPELFLDSPGGPVWATGHCDTVALGISLRPGDPPIWAYDRSAYTGVIIDGGAYHRPAGAWRPFAHDYDGDLFAADFYQGWMVRLKQTGGTWAIAPPAPGQPDADHWATGVLHASDFLIAPSGELWYCRLTNEIYRDNTGEIHRIVPPTSRDTILPPPPDPGVQLDRPVPTPARGTATVAYHLPASRRGTLRLYDLAGRRVRSVEVTGTGVWTCDGIDDHGRRLRGAVYVLRLESGGVRRERRLVLAP